MLNKTLANILRKFNDMFVFTKYRTVQLYTQYQVFKNQIIYNTVQTIKGVLIMHANTNRLMS